MTGPPKKSAGPLGRNPAPKIIDTRRVPDLNGAVNHSLITYSVHAIDPIGCSILFYVDARSEAGAWQEAQERRGVGAVQSVDALFPKEAK
jgi:hypothetical protein